MPPASYLIKSKLSLLNCYLYLGMIVLTFLASPALFYSASYPLQSNHIHIQVPCICLVQPPGTFRQQFSGRSIKEACNSH